MDVISIDWNEIILLFIGAVFGLFCSMTTMIIQSVYERAGKIRIYTKFHCLKNMGFLGWGVFENNEDRLVFLIPAIFEIENTSKRSRVLRDFSLVLIKGGNVVAKMKQIDYLQIIKNNNIPSDVNYEEFFYGDEKGSYSFVVEPSSIKKENCVFIYTLENTKKDKFDFDTIGLQYFNEKNKHVIYKIRDYSFGWDKLSNAVDEDWINIINKKCRYYF